MEKKHLWEKKLEDTFKQTPKNETAKFMDIVSMIIYNNVHNEDISQLHSAVDLETFLLITSLFEGRTITFPTKKELKNAITLALFYYYRECLGIKDYSILRKIDILNGEDFSSISIGKRLVKLNKEIIEKLENFGDILKEDNKNG